MIATMSVCLSACGDDNNNEPDYPDNKDVERIANGIIGFWVCPYNFPYNYIVFGTDGSYNAFDSFTNPYELEGYYSLRESDAGRGVLLSLGNIDYVITMPSTTDEFYLDGNMFFFRLAGTGGGSGGGSGDSDDDSYIPVEVLKITEYRFSDYSYDAEYVTMYMRERWGDIYLNKYRNDSKFWKASRNYDSDKGGYKVSYYDYKVMDSQGLHTMVYYYF